MYRFFDLCIASEHALPGLLQCEDANPDWTVTVREGRLSEPPPDWFHTWRSPAGNAMVQVARSHGGYILGFPELARFTIDFDSRRIGMQALGESTPETLSHLLLDQVLPRAVCHEGRMVAHASAVLLEDGTAIAFTGASGRGKSTLAAAFHRAGFKLLSDDCLLLDRRAEGVLAVPAYPSLRLWPDSADVMFTNPGEGALPQTRMAHYSDKKVLYPTRAEAAVDGAPLRALFLLEPPESVPDGGGIRVESARGMASIMTLVEAQFALDTVDKAAIRRNFDAVRQVCRQVPVLRLAYPRKFESLPAIVDKILKCIQEGC